MIFDNVNSRQLSVPTEDQGSLSLVSLSSDRILQFTNKNNQDSNNESNSPAQRAADGRFFCAAPTDKPEAKVGIDQKIKDTFGPEVFDHLKDQDWLIENRQKLEDGFKKVSGREAWDIARRMEDLSVVDGQSLIYLKKLDGPTHGSLIEKRHDVNLRRAWYRSDNYVGHVYH